MLRNSLMIPSRLIGSLKPQPSHMSLMATRSNSAVMKLAGQTRAMSVLPFKLADIGKNINILFI